MGLSHAVPVRCGGHQLYEPAVALAGSGGGDELGCGGGGGGGGGDADSAGVSGSSVGLLLLSCAILLLSWCCISQKSLALSDLDEEYSATRAMTSSATSIGLLHTWTALDARSDAVAAIFLMSTPYQKCCYWNTVNNTVNSVWERRQDPQESPHIPWPCVLWWLALPCARAGGVTSHSNFHTRVRCSHLAHRARTNEPHHPHDSHMSPTQPHMHGECRRGPATNWI